MALIKREILTGCKVLYTKSCTRIKSVLVLQKDASQNMNFSLLKYQLKRKKKKMTQLVCKDFPTKKWVNKVNLLSFKLKNFFKFLLV